MTSILLFIVFINCCFPICEALFSFPRIQTRSDMRDRLVGGPESRKGGRLDGSQASKGPVESDSKGATHAPSKAVAGRMYSVGVCVAYAAVSVAITFVNKVVLTKYEFKFELTLILLQLMVGTTAIFVLSQVGVCKIPRLTMDAAVTAFPLAFWFFLYVLTGLGSLRSLSVPTWSAMRRMTALFILTIDAFAGKHVSILCTPFSRFVSSGVLVIHACFQAPITIWTSVLSMLTGAIVAAAGDLDGQFAADFCK